MVRVDGATDAHRTIAFVLFDEFFTNRDWPLASAVATVLLLILVLPMMLFQRTQVRKADLS